jgi:hypothetical protein
MVWAPPWGSLWSRSNTATQPKVRGMNYPTTVGSNRRRATVRSPEMLSGRSDWHSAGRWSRRMAETSNHKGSFDAAGKNGVALCGCSVGPCADRRKRGQAKMCRGLEGWEEKVPGEDASTLAGLEARISVFPPPPPRRADSNRPSPLLIPFPPSPMLLFTSSR